MILLRCFDVVAFSTIGHQNGPRKPQYSFKMAPRGAKMAPRGYEMTPSWPKMAPRGPKMAPSRPQAVPKMAQDGRGGLKMAPRGSR